MILPVAEKDGVYLILLLLCSFKASISLLTTPSMDESSSYHCDDEWMRKLLCCGRWIPFDDGHIPETLLVARQQQQQQPQPQPQPQPQDEERAQSQMVASNIESSSSHSSSQSGDGVDRLLALYPEYFEERIPTLHVFDDFVENNVVQSLYETTMQDNQPWGTYVSMQQIRDLRKKQTEQEASMETNTERLKSQDNFTDNKEARRDHLALLAVDAFLRASISPLNASLAYKKSGNKAELNYSQILGATSRSTTTANVNEDIKSSSFWTQTDLDQLHGVAVWSLGATEGSQVPYHLDYAEQIRYETNRIVPPILAGTLQCTRTSSMVGGTYCAHVEGLEHYKRHGYKGMKDRSLQLLDTLKDDKGWIRVPYRYNRLIVQSGHLPHLSTPIESIDPNSDHANFGGIKKKRVILGFNAFLPDVGPLVQRAPEHSDVFRRKVALHRWLLSQTTDKSNNNKELGNNRQPKTLTVEEETKSDGGTTDRKTPKSNSGLTLQSVRDNPALAKFLVLAKRQKVKEDFAKRRYDLTCSIRQKLLEASHGKDSNNSSTSCEGVLVRELMEQLGRTDGEFPSPVDVQVHLHHGTKQGLYRVATSSRSGFHNDDDDDGHETVGSGVHFISSESSIRLFY